MITISLILIAVLLLVDQVSKILIASKLSLGQSIVIIPKILEFRYVRNTGAAWSMLQGKMIFFYIITVIAVGFFSYTLYKEGDFSSKKIYTLSLILIIAGALGNFIDRLVHEYVIDFINVLFINFPIFNVADILLTIGTIGFAYSILFLGEA